MYVKTCICCFAEVFLALQLLLHYQNGITHADSHTFTASYICPVG